MITRKALHAYDKKCERLGKQGRKFNELADKWNIDKFNDCKTNKCRTNTSTKGIMYEDKARKAFEKQSACERNRPD